MSNRSGPQLTPRPSIGGSPSWTSGQPLFSNAIYNSDGSTFLDASGNVSAPGTAVFNDKLQVKFSGSGGVYFSVEPTSYAYFLPNFRFGAGTGGQVYATFISNAPGIIQLDSGSDSAGCVLKFVNSTAPTTPTGGATFYANGDQMFMLDGNAVLINLSLCPQPDTGWGGNVAAPDKTVSIQAYSSVNFVTTDAGAFNTLYPITAGALTDISAKVLSLVQKVVALQATLAAGKYPNA